MASPVKGSSDSIHYNWLGHEFDIKVGDKVEAEFINTDEFSEIARVEEWYGNDPQTLEEIESSIAEAEDEVNRWKERLGFYKELKQNLEIEGGLE